MDLSTISEWLSYIKKVHPAQIELGLERVQQVAVRLNLLPVKQISVVVAGTNGKGSVIATLASMYIAQGYRVGCFTSPFLFDFNEQVRVNGKQATDEAFVTAFKHIEAARGSIALTPFEFTTLAALYIFNQQPLDIILLEVGLGGRLDAVNIVDADVAVITSIGIDHVTWLGNSREAIGFEKAGILRQEQKAVCGDQNPPQSVLNQARDLSVGLYRQDQDFKFCEREGDWDFMGPHTVLTQLPYTQLRLTNVATALMVTELLQSKLVLSIDAIKQGLQTLHWPGRLQKIEGTVTEIYDVAHNPDSVSLLTDFLHTDPCAGQTHAIFSMLNDKDMQQSIELIQSEIDAWYVAPLQTDRASDLDRLKTYLANVTSSTHYFSVISDAYQTAKQHTKPGDRLVIFGSFHTIAEVAAQNPIAFAALNKI